MPSLEDLESDLEAAHDAFRSQRKLLWDLAALSLLQSLIHVAEADLAAMKGEPYARAINMGFEHCSTGLRLLQSSEQCLLMFQIFDRMNSFITNRRFAVLRFDSCMWTTFGYPNDEAIEGHPLNGKGLDSAAVCEVFNSPWIARMRMQNRVSFPNYTMHPVRHLIFQCGDDTFECLCEGLQVVFESPDFDTAFDHAAALLRQTTQRDRQSMVGAE
jgi:hypothetical protein